MNDMMPEVFYEKLFTALEAGKRKGEHTLLEKMSEHFQLSGEKDFLSAMVRSVAPEEAMVWLLAEAAPFVRMLEEIYRLLADVKATVYGRADQFSFLFEEVNERVSFPLDSFPKTYVRALTDVEVLTTRFTPHARGRLLVDTPNYWNDDIPALRNLSLSPVLNANNFGPLPREYQQAIRSRLGTALKVLEANYTTFDVPEGVRAWPLNETKRLYCAEQSLIDGILRILRGEDARESFSQPLNDLLTAGTDAGAIVYGDRMLACLRDADQRLGDAAAAEDVRPDFPVEGLDSNLTYAFVKAYDLCFKTAPMTVRDYADIVDKVFLPFYRDRWRLFEVWALLWVRSTIPAERRPLPLLSPRADDPRSFEWVIPGGDARAPVAAWEGDGKTVELWYQQKTPLTPEQAAEFGQNQIEPDVRVRGGVPGDTSDLVVFELKDRYDAAGSEEKRIARMYATTDARLVCVANYSRFKPRHLRGRVYEDTTDGGTEILIAGEFKPGQVPPEVSEAFARAFARGGRGLPAPFDLLGDISGSVSVDLRLRAVHELLAAGLTPARVFTFNTDLGELTGGATADWPHGGGTDLAAALRKYLLRPDRSPSGRALILTDDDGVEQFRHALLTNEFDALNLLCLDVGEQFDASTIAEWAEV